MLGRMIQIILLDKLMVSVILGDFPIRTIKRCFISCEKLADLSRWEETQVARARRKVLLGIEICGRLVVDTFLSVEHDSSIRHHSICHPNAIHVNIGRLQPLPILSVPLRLARRVPGIPTFRLDLHILNF